MTGSGFRPTRRATKGTSGALSYSSWPTLARSSAISVPTWWRITRPSGGSVFRIYRDLRFSKDKSPYKTNAAVHFRHEAGRQVHGPGFYLHIEPGNAFSGAGMWIPNSETLGKIRGAIVANPGTWERIVGDETFRSMFTLEGDSLKRAPKGFDPEHPLIEHLKRKSFVAVTTFDEDEVCSPDFIDLYADSCRAAAPFSEFLTTAVGLDW